MPTIFTQINNCLPKPLPHLNQVSPSRLHVYFDELLEAHRYLGWHKPFAEYLDARIDACKRRVAYALRTHHKLPASFVAWIAANPPTRPARAAPGEKTWTPPADYGNPVPLDDETKAMLA